MVEKILAFYLYLIGCEETNLEKNMTAVLAIYVAAQDLNGLQAGMLHISPIDSTDAGIYGRAGAGGLSANRPLTKAKGERLLVQEMCEYYGGPRSKDNKGRRDLNYFLFDDNGLHITQAQYDACIMAVYKAGIGWRNGKIANEYVKAYNPVNRSGGYGTTTNDYNTCKGYFGKSDRAIAQARLFFYGEYYSIDYS